jgi:hypothetical protein
MILAKKVDFSGDFSDPVSGSGRLRGTVGPGRKTSQLEPHRVLRVPRYETDPVRIILAAQIQLRRWRQAEPGQTPHRIRQRICAIVAARDALIGAGKPLTRTV